MSNLQLPYCHPNRRSNRRSKYQQRNKSNPNHNSKRRSRSTMSSGSLVGFGASGGGSGSGGGGRKDDPVFNVKFVQLVEKHSCLWNSTLPAYSKKDEIQKAWQAIATETKDTVRNCRERWRTIRSSFLRSLKLSRTTTGRGKRKYYLSKYLQFLIPYTKTRYKAAPAATGLSNSHSSSMIATRRIAALAQAELAAAAANLPPTPNAPLPMTRINHMPLPLSLSNNSDGDDTKDSAASEVAIAEEDVLVSLHEGGRSPHSHLHQQHLPLPPLQLHPRLLAIKLEQDLCATNNNGGGASDPRRVVCNGSSTSMGGHTPYQQISDNNNPPAPLRSCSAVDLTEFAEWIKSKNDSQRHFNHQSLPADADELFLNSLHPFLKEMSGKQNRRFRQKVVALIDAVLDNAD